MAQVACSAPRRRLFTQLTASNQIILRQGFGPLGLWGVGKDAESAESIFFGDLNLWQLPHPCLMPIKAGGDKDQIWVKLLHKTGG